MLPLMKGFMHSSGHCLMHDALQSRVPAAIWDQEEEAAMSCCAGTHCEEAAIPQHSGVESARL